MEGKGEWGCGEGGKHDSRAKPRKIRFTTTPSAGLGRCVFGPPGCPAPQPHRPVNPSPSPFPPACRSASPGARRSANVDLKSIAETLVNNEELLSMLARKLGLPEPKKPIYKGPVPANPRGGRGGGGALYDDDDEGEMADTDRIVKE